MSNSKKKPPIALYVAGAVVVLGLIAFLTTRSADDGTSLREIGNVTVTGNDLPTAVDTGVDPAVGLAMPEVEGESFDGSPVAIRNDGRAKAIIFLTHW